MLKRTNFMIDKENTEYIFREKGNRFSCLFADGKSFINGTLPWHRHTEFEFDLITGCDMTFSFPNRSVTVPNGGSIFINSGVLHSYTAKKPEKCNVYAFFFDDTFLSSGRDDLIFSEYTLPIMKSGMLFRTFNPNFGNDTFLSSLRKIVELCNEEKRGYELMVKSKSLHIWHELFNSISPDDLHLPINKQANEQLEKMIDFIRNNFEKQITANDIAKSASIGTRECNRCFEKSLKTTPIKYLTSIRIEQAAALLASTDKSMTEISEMCGFSDSNYFSRVFKKQTDISPLAFRKKQNC